MKTVKTHIFLFFFLLCVTGCQYFQFPGVHKINVQQGHIITLEMLEQLESGMTRPQVRYILGTPLVADIFNDDRWDYYYSLRLGTGRFYSRTLTVYFEDDAYSHYDGENLPEPKTDDDKTEASEPDTPLPSNN